MVRINLLPWREHERRAKKIRFGIQIGASLLFAVLLIFITYFYVSSEISTELDRVGFLQAQLTTDNANLDTLKIAKDKKIKLATELSFVINLRIKGQKAIYLFDILSKTVPNSLTIEKIDRQGNVINMIGKAQSDLEITLFMKNLSQVKGFSQPVLTEISTHKVGETEERHFQLKIVQVDDV